MSRFLEKNLNKVLMDYQNVEKMEVEFENNISGNIIIKNANIKYNEKNGFITINATDAHFSINTTLVYRYEKIKNTIIIRLDNLNIYLKKKN